MRITHLLVAAALVAACHPLRHSVERENPQGFPELVKIAPQCERPLPEQLPACKEAARLIALEPRKATVEFIGYWNDEGLTEQKRRRGAQVGEKNAQSLRAREARRDTPMEWTGIPETWNKLLDVAKAGNQVDTLASTGLYPGQFETDGSIVVPAMRWVYEHGPDAYSAEMQGAAEHVEWTSHASFVVFTKAHLEAARTPAK